AMRSGLRWGFLPFAFPCGRGGWNCSRSFSEQVSQNLVDNLDDLAGHDALEDVERLQRQRTGMLAILLESHDLSQHHHRGARRIRIGLGLACDDLLVARRWH